MLGISAPTRRRRASLTPMIDVVFLLLVFFMLAARFGMPQVLPVTLGGGGGAAYDGPPRLVTVLPQGLLLNGTPVAAAELLDRLAPLMATPGDMVVLRAGEEAEVQRLVETMAALRAAGLTNLAVLP